MKPCTICRTPDAVPLARISGYDLVRCPACGLVFVDAALTPTEIADLYDAGYYGESDDPAEHLYPGYREDRDVLERNAHDLLGWIETRIPRGRILEIGCAFGFFLQAARDRGWTVAGAEISPYSSRVAREEYGLPVTTGSLEDLPPGEPYDLVCLLDTLEHLDDPADLVRRAGERLAPGGHILYTTGDIGSPFARACGKRWRMMAPPHHLYYFDRESSRRLLESTGFEEAAFARPGKRFSLRSLGRAVSGGRLRSLPGWSIPLNLGDVMTVLGRKTGVTPS